MLINDRLATVCILVLLSAGVFSMGPDMVWKSPKNVSLSESFPEVFPMEKGVWADLPTGAGSRGSNPLAHMDSKGLLWIFGGSSTALNAMWNYDPVQDQYRWVAGKANYSQQYQNFGIMGVPSDDVFPGMIATSSHAIDKNDNIWIYGNNAVPDNAMWMFNTTSLQFTYVGGNESNITPVFGDLGVESKEYWPGQLQGACTVVDSKNNMWMLGGYGGKKAVNNVWRFNTASRMWSLQWGNQTILSLPDYENKIWPGRWTPGCTIDEDDRVWLFGGYTSNSDWNDMWSFDTKTVTWTVERETNDSTLPGNVASFGTFDVDNYPSKRDYVNMIDRRDGSIMLFGGRDIVHNRCFNDVWVFNKTSKYWKVVAGTANNYTFTESVFGEYRGSGSQLGSRQAYGSESGLNAKGHLIIVGGEHTGGTYLLNDIWIIPQDQCLTSLHSCSPNASCTMGSLTYECACNEGYTGDGKTCTAITPVASTAPTAAPISTQPKALVSTISRASTHATPFIAALIIQLFIVVI